MRLARARLQVACAPVLSLRPPGRLRQFLASQDTRQELIRLWRENEISDKVLHHLEEILDYQEAHLQRPRGPCSITASA